MVKRLLEIDVSVVCVFRAAETRIRLPTYFTVCAIATIIRLSAVDVVAIVTGYAGLAGSMQSRVGPSLVDGPLLDRKLARRRAPALHLNGCERFPAYSWSDCIVTA